MNSTQFVRCLTLAWLFSAPSLTQTFSPVPYDLAQWTREWAMQIDGLNYRLVVSAADKNAKHDVYLVLEGGNSVRLEGTGNFEYKGKKLKAELKSPTGNPKGKVDLFLFLHYFDRHVLAGSVEPNPSYPNRFLWSPVSGNSIVVRLKLPAKSAIAPPSK